MRIRRHVRAFTGMVLSCPRALFWAAVSLFGVFFGAVLATSFLALLEGHVRHFFRRFFVDSPSFTGMVFPCPGAVFCRVLGCRVSFSVCFLETCFIRFLLLHSETIKKKCIFIFFIFILICIFMSFCWVNLNIIFFIILSFFSFSFITFCHQTSFFFIFNFIFFHLQLHIFFSFATSCFFHFPLFLMVFHCFSLILMVFLDFRCHGQGK